MWGGASRATPQQRRHNAGANTPHRKMYKATKNRTQQLISSLPPRCKNDKYPSTNPAADKRGCSSALQGSGKRGCATSTQLPFLPRVSLFLSLDSLISLARSPYNFCLFPVGCETHPPPFCKSPVSHTSPNLSLSLSILMMEERESGEMGYASTSTSVYSSQDCCFCINCLFCVCICLTMYDIITNKE